ncbi:uncharacterized protein LOC123216432 [Mangifera indica]|uniref:uncharacterized protein LOC123216432 n=1 Tax=Mangifera indica TaxID=29780 RepID=UPI001CFAF915|nr:uncharacterized protein LOC123216432 [Mangifera indica]
MVLLGNDRRKKVSTEYLQLVDHLDGFNSYPWGVVVWQMTYDSMSQTCERLCSGRMQEIRKYDLYGFPFAFQYWIYETLETLHEWIDLVDLYVSPRMLRWRTRDVPVWTHIGRIFTGDPEDVTFPLRPSVIEEGLPWYAEIREYTGLPDADSSSSSSTPTATADGAPPSSRHSDVPVETSETREEPIQTPVIEQHVCSPVVQSPRTTDHPRVEEHPTVDEHPSVEDHTTLAHWGATILREISSFRDDISSQMTRLRDDIYSQMTRLEDRMTRLEDIVTRIYSAPVVEERDDVIGMTSPIDTAIPSHQSHEGHRQDGAPVDPSVTSPIRSEGLRHEEGLPIGSPIILDHPLEGLHIDISSIEGYFRTPSPEVQLVRTARGRIVRKVPLDQRRKTASGGLL